MLVEVNMGAGAGKTQYSDASIFVLMGM